MNNINNLERNKNVICNILDNNITASLSTINERGPHSNTIYFCYDDNLNIYYASDCSTEHSINITHNKNVALSIWDNPKQYGQNHRGLQIEGTCIPVAGLDLIRAWDLYIKRFPVFKLKVGNVINIVDKVINMRLYKVSISRIQITDTEQYGTKIIDVTNE